MASHDYDICNLALLAIGQRELITSLTGTDVSLTAKICTLRYPQTRDALLARAPWRFATRTLALVAEGAAPAARLIPGWGYVYDLPTDYLEAQYVFSGARPGQGAIPLVNPGIFGISQVSMLPALNGVAMQVPFLVQGGYVFVDQSPAQLIYTAQPQVGDDVSAFPAVFVEALAAQLAVHLAMGSAAKATLAKGLQELADREYEKAQAAEGNAEQPDLRPDSSFIAIRG